MDEEDFIGFVSLAIDSNSMATNIHSIEDEGSIHQNKCLEILYAVKYFIDTDDEMLEDIVAAYYYAIRPEEGFTEH